MCRHPGCHLASARHNEAAVTLTLPSSYRTRFRERQAQKTTTEPTITAS